jgi:hypothetical protein
MAGATAATAAGVTGSQAGLVTINLSNNYISATGGNHLNADLTEDGHPDLTITRAFYRAYVPTFLYGTYTARVSLNGVLAYGHLRTENIPRSGFIKLGSQATSWLSTDFNSYHQLTGSIPIFFKDLHINGGKPTGGSLQVSAFPTEIHLDSLTYSSNTPVAWSSRTVPDQGSSLAILAMGADGVLALRRCRATQTQS